MRYLKIFLLHFQDVFHSRGRSFVWFLVSFINASIYLLFWRGAIAEKGSIFGIWNEATITSYYLLMIIGASFLTVHIEEDVALRDIQEGSLSRYLLRPFPYFLIKFMEEFPWRVVQGSFGIVVFLFFFFVLRLPLSFVHGVAEIFLSGIILLLGLSVSYVFKMLIGITAFWTTDYYGTQNLVDVLTIIFGGYILPLGLYPEIFRDVAYAFPFAYITYFPIAAIDGIFTIPELLRIVAAQLVWIFVLGTLFHIFWKKGLATFTAVGQ